MTVGRFRYEDRFHIVGRGPVFTGPLEDGTVSPGDTLVVGERELPIVGVERMGVRRSPVGLLVKIKKDDQLLTDLRRGAVFEVRRSGV